MHPPFSHLRPGQQIRVDQTINRREGSWRKSTTGELLEILAAPTGSWYAHGAKDRYWLLRLRIRKACGEITLLSLSPDSDVSILGANTPIAPK
ncbi:MAG: hypothetical protein DHS20C16_04630 [Phycisphaerae bacterium]|nr:MAG: hypothetical protein DHS20C16_04630 [Phycisphaerae bacterium]